MGPGAVVGFEPLVPRHFIFSEVSPVSQLFYQKLRNHTIGLSLAVIHMSA